jgi:hypothetical protein
LQVQGSTLIHLRRRPGWPGFVAEGANAASGETIWSTQLAVPIVALEISEARKAVEVVTAGGRLFTLTGDQLKGTRRRRAAGRRSCRRPRNRPMGRR